MKHITKLKLAAVYFFCEEEEKSTEYMIQFMQDTCKVDHDCVIKFLTVHEKEIPNLINETREFANVLGFLGNSFEDKLEEDYESDITERD